ncbi:hypothetical protein F4703DRAFT_1870645 [Phycomyces blakesleeanus]
MQHSAFSFLFIYKYLLILFMPIIKKRKSIENDQDKVVCISLSFLPFLSIYSLDRYIGDLTLIITITITITITIVNNNRAQLKLN